MYSILFIDGAVLNVADPTLCDIMITQQTFAENMVHIQQTPDRFQKILNIMKPSTRGVWKTILDQNIIVEKSDNEEDEQY